MFTRAAVVALHTNNLVTHIEDTVLHRVCAPVEGSREGGGWLSGLVFVAQLGWYSGLLPPASHDNDGEARQAC